MRSWLTFLALFLFGSSSALACSCAVPDSERSRFDGASHVFTAVVTDVKVVRIGDALLSKIQRNKRISGPQIVEASFRVTDTFKGDPDSLVALYTATESTACGVSLSLGDEFIFFTDAFGAISKCGGNIASDSPAWPRVLGEVRRFETEPPFDPFARVELDE